MKDLEFVSEVDFGKYLDENCSMQRHYIQQNILRELLKLRSATFTQLNILHITNDHFNFHLQQLVKENLISKEGNKYSLTPQGMELAGRIDVNSANLIHQPKISITLGVFRNNDTEVLVLKRLRSQSYGQYAWLDRKWRVGRSIKEEIYTLLEEESGLYTDNYLFSGATHVIRKENNNLEIDAVLLNFKVTDPTGELKSLSKDGENSWFKINEIKAIDEEEKLIGFNERLDGYLENKIILQEFITER